MSINLRSNPDNPSETNDSSEAPDRPTVLRPDVIGELGPDPTKNQTDVIKAEAGVMKARLDVAKEGLKTVQSAFDTIGKFVDLEATRTEWSGRVEEAREKVRLAVQDVQKAQEKTRQAEIGLEKAKEDGRQQTAALASVAEARDATVRLLNGLLDDADVPGLDSEERRALRDQAIGLAKLLSQYRP